MAAETPLERLGAGNSANVKKAKLITKPGYNIDTALGSKVQNSTVVGSKDWNQGPLKEMTLGNPSGTETRLGVIFPYNPTINVVNSVNYGQYDLTHTNYQPHFYNNTQNMQITVSFQFSATTLQEANYMLGFLFFARVITKMHWGAGDPLAGTPPPVLEWSCYGDYQFFNMPVVVRSVSYDQPGTEDYVDTSYDTQVPTFLQGFIDIIAQYTPGKVLKDFTLQDFASGKLIRDGKGYI